MTIRSMVVNTSGVAPGSAPLREAVLWGGGNRLRLTVGADLVEARNVPPRRAGEAVY